MPRKILQPALIIGVGGSGIEIVRRFKRRFLDTYGPTPYVQLLGIDTAPQISIPDLMPLSDEEFVYASDIRTEFYVGPNHIDQHPAIRDWWVYELPTKFIKQGAGMRRPFGRLALFVHHGTIVQRLKGQLSSIFNNEVFHDLPSQYQKAINVYIVSSTCGGTGTGMFLDLAYILQQLVPETMPNVTVWLRGILLLPSAFLGTGTVPAPHAAALRTNAYGALTELDASMSKSAALSEVRYPNGGVVKRDDAPFRTCFLVGNQTAAGAVLTDFAELLERASVQIQIDLASPISETGEARMDNIIQAIAAKPDSKGRPRLYSAFSNDWIELPSARLFTRWTKGLASQLIERLQRSDGVTENLARQLDQAHGYGRLRTIVSGKGLNDYLPQVQAEIDYFMDIGPDGLAISQLIERAQQLHSAAERQVQANTALLRLVDDNLDQVLPEIRAVIREMSSDRSLNDIRLFLADVHAEIDKWLSRARTQAGDTLSDQWLIDFRNQASSLKKGVLTRSEKYASDQGQLVIDALGHARDSWQRALRARVASRLQDKLPAFLAEVAQLRNRVDQIRTLVPSVAALVQKVPEPVVPRGLDTTALTDSVIDEAFANPARLERLEYAAGQALKALLDKQLPTSDDLLREIWSAAFASVRDVAPEFLETLSIPSSEIAKRLTKLSPFAVFRPDWNANPDSEDIQSLWLVGLPESSSARENEVKSSLPAHIRSITEFVGHRDEERVLMTVQSHGFPLYALSETHDCSHAFSSSESSERDLVFVFPDESLTRWEFRPADATESRLRFGVALALSFVRRAGDRYLYSAPHGHARDSELDHHQDPGEARRRARDAFFAAGHASTVRAYCDVRMERESNQPLYHDLKAWVEREEDVASTNPDYPDEFKVDIESVKAYLDIIRPF